MTPSVIDLRQWGEHTGILFLSTGEVSHTASQSLPFQIHQGWHLTLVQVLRCSTWGSVIIAQISFKSFICS